MKDFAKECDTYVRRIADELAQIMTDGTDADGEEKDIYDYVSEALDVEYIIDSKLRYESARLYVTLGGPTCWIDTDADGGTVQLRWGTDSAQCCLPMDARDALDDIMEENYNSLRDSH